MSPCLTNQFSSQRIRSAIVFRWNSSSQPLSNAESNNGMIIIMTASVTRLDVTLAKSLAAALQPFHGLVGPSVVHTPWLVSARKVSSVDVVALEGFHSLITRSEPPRRFACRRVRATVRLSPFMVDISGLHLTSAPPTAGVTRSPTLCSRFCESS